MATVPSISTIINVAIISQYKAIADIRSKRFCNNQVPNKTLPQLIRSVRKSIQWAYTYNPADPTLIKTSEYCFALCAPYSQSALQILANVSAVAPIVSGPSNDSVFIGQNASFTISVISTLSYTIAWYRNGLLIPGATSLTYTLSNAQLTDSGSTFYATVTNSAGQSVSATGVLTVTAGLIGFWYAGGTDYSVQLVAGNDSVAYSGTFSITDGQPFNVPFPIGQSDFVIIKYPVSQGDRIHYANPVAGVDQASIPGLAFDQNTFGGNHYTFSRSGNEFGINNTTGIVQFS